MSRSEISSALIKYRNFTPLPFLVLLIAYINANIWSIITGFLIALYGELIRLWSAGWAGNETGITGPDGSTALVISGPFARIRNPLYVGNILLYFGLGLMSFALFPYLQIAGLIFFCIQYNLIAREEENYLQKMFGLEFENYMKHVRRFFPRLTKYKPGNTIEPVYSFSAGLKYEKRGIQAFGIIALTIFLLWYLQRV